jgi:rhamnose transport system ATP-binding protein
VPIGEVVLQVSGLSNATEYADVSFDLRKGEILGLYGLVGAGRTEAMQGLFGITPVKRGSVSLEGQRLAFKSPADAINAGISYVPEDRQDQGAILSLGIRENVTLANLSKHVRGLFLSRASERAETRTLGRRLAVKAAHWEQRLAELSGGNQQKVVIAKWLATRPKVIVLDEPTKGIDVGSKAAVHDFIGELAGEGLAVILITSELPEVMGLADRVIVMKEGRIVDEFKRGHWSAEEIVGAATGARREAA